MTSSWWQRKVDEPTRHDVERWVKELELETIYRDVCEAAGSSAKRAEGDRNGLADRLLTPFVRAKKEFFRAWYRVFR